MIIDSKDVKNEAANFDTVDNVISENSTTGSGVELETKEEENEALYNEALDKLNGYGLKWTFRSIKYIIETHDISFNQLRSCVFKRYNKETKEREPEYNLYRALRLLIAAGIVGKEENNKPNKEIEQAENIIEDWQDSIGFIGVLHILIIDKMEKQHFFMGMQDLKILEHLSSKNSQTDLIKTLQATDLEMRIHQAQAMQS